MVLECRRSTRKSLHALKAFVVFETLQYSNVIAVLGSLSMDCNLLILFSPIQSNPILSDPIRFNSIQFNPSQTVFPTHDSSLLFLLPSARRRKSVPLVENDKNLSGRETDGWNDCWMRRMRMCSVFHDIQEHETLDWY